MEDRHFRLGVDIGGTFTDIVALGRSGEVRTMKVLSTPDDYGRAIVDGVSHLLMAERIAPAEIADIIHATTVVTNTVLEFKGARTALVTTAGFRDVLEMRRLRIPEMYNLQYEKPAPLVPRRLRFEVTERMGPKGEVWQSLDEASVLAVAARLAAMDVEAVAIALLHSHANDGHELRVEELLRQVLPRDVYIARSSRILPEIREYERTSTTVVSAYVGPVVERYLSRLEQQLATVGLSVPLRVVQSNGGAMTCESAIGSPAHLLESGPAAGVIACARAAARIGLKDVISFDMGGTTAKAAMVENGEPARTSEYEVGAGINLSSKLVKGGGYAVKLPFIDVSEIGAGGGSIISLGPEQTIRVGPQSAGASPGPACYGKGGTEPTFTDAMVVLGYLNPGALVGGALPIDAILAHRAIETRIAAPLGKPLLEVAYGIYALASVTMTRAVKAVTTYRGRDPRDFALFAFGGNGPIIAGAIAQELGIRRVLIPPAPGVFSAFGLPFSEIEHEAVRSVFVRCEPAQAAGINALFNDMHREVSLALQHDGVQADNQVICRRADMRYAGQAYELTVPIPDPIDGDCDLAAIFHREHQRTYGHFSVSDPVDIISLKVVGRGKDSFANNISWKGCSAGGTRVASRRAFFGAEHGLMETPVLSRADLPASPITGPVIIEEYDATCVVPPMGEVRRDGDGNIEISFRSEP